MSADTQRVPRVLMVAPDPRDPGGISAVIASWRAAGLAREVELTELHTSAMGSPLPAKLIQAAAALLRFVAALAGRPRPDLVHLHASTGGSLWRKLGLALCCRAARVPYVGHEHSGELVEWIGASRLRAAGARALYSRAAATVVLGERWRAPMAALGSGRIEVIANGLAEAQRLDLGRARGLREASRGVDGEQPRRLLFYGRWAPKKGPDRLAAALRRIDRGDYELRIYGSGDRERIKRVFARLEGEVRIGGWLGGEEKVRELGLAAAVIAPSRAEGLPVALVEARAAGAPVIASDVGAVADALAGYGLGLLLAADDEAALPAALERLLDGEWPDAVDPGELPEQLRSEHAVGRLVALYRSVSEGGRC